ncbi:MAG: SufD family Fe-S cluster assembly protein [Candidatus Micrarchaeaceae archaeon]
MENISQYLKDSNSFYESMPEETNELYKRKYVSINLDNVAKLIGFNTPMGAGKAQPKPKTAQFFKEHFANAEMKFDALLGEDDFIATGIKAKYMRFIKQDEEDYENISGLFMENFEDDKYTAFIYSYANGMLHVRIPKGEKAQINMLLANIERPFSTMLFFEIEEDAELNVIEFFTSGASGASFLGTANIALLGRRAKAEINMLHNEGPETDVVSLSYMRALAGASAKANYIYVGGNRVKAKNRLDAAGAASSVEANEVIFSSRRQAFDINTKIVNSSSGINTTSKLESRAVAAEDSTCYLKGFSKIENGAKGAKAFLNERGFHLSKRAKIETMPHMSIDEREVNATHSSATGPIDAEALFYLMSRGIENEEAKNLMIFGFLISTISNIESGAAKAYSLSLISRKLAGKEGIGLPRMESLGMWLEGRPGGIWNRHKYR